MMMMVAIERYRIVLYFEHHYDAPPPSPLVDISNKISGFIIRWSFHSFFSVVARRENVVSVCPSLHRVGPVSSFRFSKIVVSAEQENPV
jgi:hypothetical protein